MINRKTAIIHIDAVRREFPGNYVLAKKLSSHGYKVGLTSRITTKIIAQLTNVDIIIVSHSNTFTESDLLKFIQKGVRIYVIDVEGHLRWEEAISGQYKQEANLNIFSGILVWNKWSREWIINNREVNHKNVVVTGSVRTSLYNFIEKNQTTNVVGILGRFEHINIFDDRHNFQSLTKHHKQGGYWRQFKLRRWKYDLDLFSACMDVIDIALKSGKKVSIRPHPNENFENYKIIEKYFNGQVIIDVGVDYLDWLSNIDILVGSKSTAFSEAYLAEIPIVSLDEMIDDSYLEGYREGGSVNQTCAHVPKNKEELMSLLNQNQLPSISSHDFENHLNDHYDLENGNAIERVVSYINNSLELTNRKSVFQNFWLGLVVNIVDFLVLIAVFWKSILNKNYYKKFKNYHYNKYIHKPSNLMIRACNKMES